MAVSPADYSQHCLSRLEILLLLGCVLSHSDSPLRSSNTTLVTVGTCTGRVGTASVELVSGQASALGYFDLWLPHEHANIAAALQGCLTTAGPHVSAKGGRHSFVKSVQSDTGKMAETWDSSQLLNSPGGCRCPPQRFGAAIRHSHAWAAATAVTAAVAVAHAGDPTGMAGRVLALSGFGQPTLVR